MKKPYLQGWAVSRTRRMRLDRCPHGLILRSAHLLPDEPLRCLFIRRPVVEPELFARCGRRLIPAHSAISMALPLSDRTEPAKPGEERRAADSKGKSDKAAPDVTLFGLHEQPEQFAAGLHSELGRDLDLGQDVGSAATASKLGDYFQYGSIMRSPAASEVGPSAHRGQDVEGERVSIYNERTHAKFPPPGLVFKNTTGMHLTQGPITVYEGSTYAGDARHPRSARRMSALC